ncbi:hypothetical protein Cs7R123_50940 [Catellatospora sp. TT07R-123]|uniref:hypothetical protein n=1 Tax=Catellatospora sp. TT07R-123 TaxID=2733863 RepID=UPI001AFE367B|nr:hypothetical protein [Catellatospora sp. TT07R-123]GHJ47752.1 hypothetical protein Cs7R123_50940 [Catellatospora sp. TT07R-123]
MARVVTEEGAADYGPIAQVQEGMRVYDSAGADLGEVVDVKLGDPLAVTEEGQLLGEPRGLLGVVLDPAAGEPHVPWELAQGLLRAGYVKIHHGGLLHRHTCYAPAGDVAGVDGDTVRLSVTREQLLPEQ